MKTPRLFTLVLMLVAVMGGLAPRSAKAEVSFNYFYDNLEPYGEWLEVADYGYCWRPSQVDAEWTPYSDGYWAYTDSGWTWVSYEDWGGICYHYGRWVNLEDEGWCWVPDYEWGPAWVSWRTSEEHVGWAPLPPAVRFRHEVGISVWVDSSYDIGPGYYNFCSVRDFGAPVLRAVIYPRWRNVVILEQTLNVTNITYYNDRVYCGGPRYTVVSSQVSRPVPVLKLVQNTNITINNITSTGNNVTINQRGSTMALQKGNTLQVMAPVVVAPASKAEFRSARPMKVIAQARATNGWAGVEDPQQRVALRQKIKSEAKGQTAETAPAKPVDVAELKMVPTQADVNAPSPVATVKPKPGGENGRATGAGQPAVGIVQPGPNTGTAQGRKGPREGRTDPEKLSNPVVGQPSGKPKAGPGEPAAAQPGAVVGGDTERAGGPVSGPKNGQRPGAAGNGREGVPRQPKGVPIEGGAPAVLPPRTGEVPADGATTTEPKAERVKPGKAIRPVRPAQGTQDPAAEPAQRERIQREPTQRPQAEAGPSGASEEMARARREQAGAQAREQAVNQNREQAAAQGRARAEAAREQQIKRESQLQEAQQAQEAQRGRDAAEARRAQQEARMEGARPQPEAREPQRVQRQPEVVREQPVVRERPDQGRQQAAQEVQRRAQQEAVNERQQQMRQQGEAQRAAQQRAPERVQEVQRQPQAAPGQKGHRPLTREEAEALQRQEGR